MREAAELVKQLRKALIGVALNYSADTDPLASWCDDGWMCDHQECKDGRAALYDSREFLAPSSEARPS